MAAFVMVSPAAAVDQNTAFLPFQIIAQSVDESLTAEVDDSLTSVLLRNNFQMLDRMQAEDLVDYSKWPPDTRALDSIAEATGFDNVAAGSVTIIGSQISIDIKVYDVLNPENPRYFYKEAGSMAELGMIIDQVMDEVISYAERDQFIGAIAPQGNTRIDSGAILRKIQSKSGQVYDPAVLREDLKAIYKMGYFDDVQIDVKDSDSGKIVTFRVVEKPAISSISYSGIDELDDDDVTEVVGIKENSILNPARVNEAAAALTGYTREELLHDVSVAEVEHQEPPPEEARALEELDRGRHQLRRLVRGDADHAEAGRRVTAPQFQDRVRRDVVRVLPVAALEHDNGILAAQFEVQVLDKRGRLGADALPGFQGTGEGDHAAVGGGHRAAGEAPA